KTETFEQFVIPIEFREARANEILGIYEDRHGNLWVAAWKAFYRFDRRNGKFIRIKGAAPSDYGKLGGKIYRDRQDNIWGLNRTLSTVDLKTLTVHRYRPFANPLRERGIDVKYNNPNGFHEDANGMIWCGTRMGLHKLDPRQGKFVAHYYEEDGLLSNFVLQITGDDFGKLWVLTNRGISIFDKNKPLGEQFTNLSAEEGILNTSTSSDAFIKSKNGDIFWGGSNGLYRFFPEVQNTNPFIPKVRFTEFKIFNRHAKLDSVISEISTITLAHNENFFSFAFAALDFTNPLQNRYAYKLKGIDGDWVKAGNKTEASYTSVPPGRYIFKAKGSNNDGVWNEQGATVHIVIIPPWWRSNLAYAVYAVLLIAAFYGWRRFEMNKARLRNELKMQKFEAQKLQEIDSVKSRFFANISHEFRTPLTLILGPVEQMLSGDFRGNVKENYRMILRNGRRLLRLINQLLDLSTLEAGRMTLQARRENIVPLLKGLVLSFASLAERKKIVLNFHAEKERIDAYVDRDKLEKIATNLLSNAFKFTPEGGKISVLCSVFSVQLSDDRIPDTEICLRITVADTGPGIPAEHLDKIFDRFYQQDSTHKKDQTPLDRGSPTERPLFDRAYPTGQEGSGIGLALTKELVEMHHGKILVESKEGKGTTFSVLLPLGKAHLKDNEITSEEIPEPSSVNSEPFSLVNDQQFATSDQQPATNIEQPEANDQTVVLVVEDNRDVRYYIRQHLKSEFAVVEAEDGAAGLETALEIIPDLIISDVMMPKMDGYELCRFIKNDEKTSHIPIILLTAKASSPDKIEGLETGADDYLIKPFDAKELLARIKNLIKMRQQLRERFSREVFLKPQEIAVAPMDEVFLRKVQSVVEENMSDEGFCIDRLSKKVGMSRTQIHRKLRALIDQSATQFIRSMRLQRAVDLLRQKAGTVAEITYMVGFGSQAYFTKCFHE
ncbi:MAG: response regulator, partial [bacterium]